MGGLRRELSLDPGLSQKFRRYKVWRDVAIRTCSQSMLK